MYACMATWMYTCTHSHILCKPQKRHPHPIRTTNTILTVQTEIWGLCCLTCSWTHTTTNVHVCLWTVWTRSHLVAALIDLCKRAARRWRDQRMSGRVWTKRPSWNLHGCSIYMVIRPSRATTWSQPGRCRCQRVCQQRHFALCVFVNGGSVTVNAVPDASARLPGMCYFRCKKIQIHQRTSALFLPTLTHLCLTIVDSDTLAYWALLADWWNLYFEVVCLELSDFLSGADCGKAADSNTKNPWTE